LLSSTKWASKSRNSCLVFMVIFILSSDCLAD
jgi:hypothetical protein